MTIGGRIKARRIQLGLSADEVAVALNKNRATVYRYESEDIEKLPTTVLEPLAKVLRTTPAYLMGWEDTLIESNVSEFLDTDKIYMIPVFENVSAGFGAYACSDVADYIPLYISNRAEVPDTIAIRVKGNSMYPKIENGDTIVVHKQCSVDSGSIAVVLLDSEEALVEKVEYGANWIDLISINPEYPVKHFEDEDVLRLNVIGLVKKIVKNL